MIKEDIIGKSINLRHELHRNAELSENENKTMDILKKFISENSDFEIVEKSGYFYAVHKVNEDCRNIAFRADIDALPIAEELELQYKSVNRGVSHKCGHDGHSAVMAGLCMACRDIKEKNIYCLFQPGEEIGKGAKKIVEDGFIKENNIDEIYAFHNIPGEKEGVVLLKEGVFACTSKGIIINLIGTPSHAAYPESGVNPSYGAAELISSLKNITKSKDYKSMVLCTIINVDIGERAFGTSAGSGKIMVTIRAEEESDLMMLQNKILNEVNDVSSKYKLKNHIEFCDEFPETRNNMQCLNKIEDSCRNNNFEFKKITSPFRWSEDFGYYTKETKGAIIGIGAGENHAQLHTSKYDFPDGIIERSIEVFCSLLK